PNLREGPSRLHEEIRERGNRPRIGPRGIRIAERIAAAGGQAGPDGPSPPRQGDLPAEDPGVGGGELLDDAAGSIRAGVRNDDDLPPGPRAASPRLEGLPMALDEGADERRLVAGGQHDGEPVERDGHDSRASDRAASASEAASRPCT